MPALKTVDSVPTPVETITARLDRVRSALGELQARLQSIVNRTGIDERQEVDPAPQAPASQLEYIVTDIQHAVDALHRTAGVLERIG